MFTSVVNLVCKDIYMQKNGVTLFFKVSLLKCNYTFEYWVKLINYTYLLYG